LSFLEQMGLVALDLQKIVAALFDNDSGRAFFGSGADQP
jgi:hypothetical protein